MFSKVIFLTENWVSACCVLENEATIMPTSEAPYPSGKGAVCKTAMQRFEPARRLHTNLLRTYWLFIALFVMVASGKASPVFSLAYHLDPWLRGAANGGILQRVGTRIQITSKVLLLVTGYSFQRFTKIALTFGADLQVE